MAAVRFLLVIAFALGVNVPGVFGSDFIGYGTRKQEIATGRRAPRNDPRGLIKIAEQEIGVREIGSNCGPRIRQYLAYVGFNEGVAWCAGFTSWCHGQAGFAQPKTAWCPSLFPKNKVVSVALPGCIYGIYFPALGRIAHVGIVLELKGDWLSGVEGNTNVAGSREGDGVFKKLRHKRTIAKYADWLRGD